MLCLLNKNVYKTKQNKLYLQNKQTFTKQKFYKHVMFTKQNKMFTDKLCIQNNQMFTKQKFYKHVMFIKQKCTGKLYLQNKIQNRKFTKQN